MRKSNGHMNTALPFGSAPCWTGSPMKVLSEGDIRQATCEAR